MRNPNKQTLRKGSVANDRAIKAPKLTVKANVLEVDGYTQDVPISAFADAISLSGGSFAPSSHASTHYAGGSDELLVSDLGAAAASVDFNGNQALSFVIENRTSDPASPVTGQMWIRTDL